MMRELLQGLHSPWERVYLSPAPEEHRAARIWCKESLSLRFDLAWTRIEAAAFAYALPEALALLGRHVLPAFGKTIRDSIGRTVDHAIRHATAGTRMPAAVESKSTEENPAKGQNSECLPEA